MTAEETIYPHRPDGYMTGAEIETRVALIANYKSAPLRINSTLANIYHKLQAGDVPQIFGNVSVPQGSIIAYTNFKGQKTHAIEEHVGEQLVQQYAANILRRAKRAATCAPHEGYKISFCITCKGRLDHLKETLPANLKSVADYPNVEFVVLDYDSQDGLEAWIKEHFSQEIKEGKIRYAKFEPAPHFQMAHAKNMAHRVATGGIVCNLDADNYLAKGFAGWLNDQFIKDPHIFVRMPNKRTLINRWLKEPNDSPDKQDIGSMLDLWEQGLAGRVAIRRDSFGELHGYDEKFSSWGDDDNDFENRARQLGLRKVNMPVNMAGGVILNDNDIRVENMSAADKMRSRERLAKRFYWRQHIESLKPASYEEIDTIPLANPDGNFGCGTVELNFITQQELVPHPQKLNYSRHEEKHTGSHRRKRKESGAEEGVGIQ